MMLVVVVPARAGSGSDVDPPATGGVLPATGGDGAPLALLAIAGALAVGGVLVASPRRRLGA
jgi:LPXTG-motif cell wall-anchored protein